MCEAASRLRAYAARRAYGACAIRLAFFLHAYCASAIRRAGALCRLSPAATAAHTRTFSGGVARPNFFLLGTSYAFIPISEDFIAKSSLEIL